jgi:hypothetical protein
MRRMLPLLLMLALTAAACAEGDGSGGTSTLPTTTTVPSTTTTSSSTTSTTIPPTTSSTTTTSTTAPPSTTTTSSTTTSSTTTSSTTTTSTSTTTTTSPTTTTSTSTTTTTAPPTTTTTTVPVAACRAPAPLPAGVTLDDRLVTIHRWATALARSTTGVGAAVSAAADFSAGWGARPPVAAAVYGMETDLFSLAARIESAFRADGGAFTPGQGWDLPAGYPLAPLAGPWEDIPTFQAVTLPAFFRMGSRDAALTFFETGGVCGFATAFSAAVDATVELSAG